MRNAIGILCLLIGIAGPLFAQSRQGATAASATQPAANFFGISLDTERVVLIVDHSGSMLDGFDSVLRATTDAVNSLKPFQSFAVIMVSDKVTPLTIPTGPAKLR